MKKHLCLSIIAIACFLAGPGFAADEGTFAKANQAYAEARFQEAAEGYESLVQSRQWSATLFYDLGNAYYRLGSFGKAILNYERALALDPRHPEAEANLRLARDEARALELRKGLDRALCERGDGEAIHDRGSRRVLVRPVHDCALCSSRDAVPVGASPSSR